MSVRKIRGKSDHVVVVGAGLSGLSTALHLAGRGRTVTVVEREDWPGGRAGRLDVRGYRIDTGPTVLTMSDLIDEAFAAVGENRADHLELLPIEPAYRAQFADGSAINVHSDADQMAAAVEQFAGREQANGYLKLRDWLSRLYRTEFDGFIGSNFDSPLNLLNPRLAKLAALGGFGGWERMVHQYITDPRLIRVFTFQSLYAGVAPREALAAYAVIAYMDTISGVFFPRGGVRALPDALAAAAVTAGVRFHYGSTVTAAERKGDRVVAIQTDRGERIPCDAVVLTTELPTTYRLLGYRPRRPIPLRAAPSALIAHLGCRHRDRQAGGGPAHHTILFGDAWDQTFTEIIRDGTVMKDPSLLVTCPTVTEPALAPEGRDLIYLLAPTPNLQAGPIDWDSSGPEYAAAMTDIVAGRLAPELRDDVDVLDLVTPADWARQGMLAGSPFALSHTFAQTGPFRPANLVRGLDNAVLAGSSTVPGVGVPTTLISGRLAADRITGTVQSAATHLDVKRTPC